MKQRLFKRCASILLLILPFQSVPLRRNGIAIGGIKPQIQRNRFFRHPHRLHPQDLAQTRCFEPFAILNFLFVKEVFVVEEIGGGLGC